MSKTVTVEEFARDVPAYITEVADRGGHVFLKRGDRIVAELRPLGRTVTLAELPALFESLPRLSPEDAEAFEKDINEAREWMNSQRVRDPWES